MIGKVYMMLCERARPAGIEVTLARSSRQGTFVKLKHLPVRKVTECQSLGGPWGFFMYKMYQMVILVHFCTLLELKHVPKAGMIQFD